MNMKKLLYNKIAILLIICSFGLYSCGESYLETDDHESLSENIFPTTLNQANLLVASVYGVLHDWEFLGNYWGGYAIWCFDHTVDQHWRGDQTWIDIHAGTVKLGNTKVENPWKALNRGVYYSNSALEGIRKYRPIALSTEQEKLNHYEGEVLFLRGFYWWHMQLLYGQPNLDGVGIPIVTATPKSLDDMSVPRLTTREGYQAMINDFKQAAELLRGQNDNHRATEWSAKSALAKAYFFAGKTDSAEIYLKDCIDNSGKRLVSFDVYMDMYNDNPANEYNSESFFEMGNIDDPVNGDRNGSGTTIALYTQPWYVAADNSTKSTAYANQFMHDRNLFRFGYKDDPPLRHLQFDAEGNGYLEQAYLNQQWERRGQMGKQADGPDPRLYVSSLQPYLDSLKVNGVYYKIAQGECTKWWILDVANGYDAQTFYGWSLRKYTYLDGHLTSEMRSNAGNNIYFIRLPDIYLMYAEILKNSGRTAEALEYVNKAHRRAYNYPPDSPSPVDYKTLSDRTKTIEDSDPLANDPLLYERWAELFGEMRWWEDVKRLQLGKKEAAYYQYVSGTGDKKTPLDCPDWHYAMPIMQLEFESNKNPGFVQTPGY
jgi:hypothetical protein